MNQYREPTTAECTARAEVQLTDEFRGWACWYPTMGGYTSRCVVVKDAGCVDAYVWHDGEFPFSGPDHYGDVRPPTRLHHCSGDAFVGFGEFVAELQEKPASFDVDGDLNDKADRLRDFVQRAIGERRPPRSDEALFDALSDLLEELERMRYGETVGPDGRMWARLALGDLAHVWADVDQVEQYWLGGDGAPA